MAEEMNANESGLNMGVLADIASLASEKNVSDETVRSLNEKVPGADKADQAEKKRGRGSSKKSTVSRRSKAESGSKDSEELSPERAVAESLSDLRNLKAKHAPAPKKSAEPASEDEVASTIDRIFEGADDAANSSESSQDEAAAEQQTAVLPNTEQVTNEDTSAAEPETTESVTEKPSSEDSPVTAVQAPAAQADTSVATAGTAEEPQVSEPETGIVALPEVDTPEDESEEKSGSEGESKTLRDVQQQKLAQMRASLTPRAMPLFYSPNVAELSAAATLEYEQQRAARIEAERAARMARRLEEVAAEAEVTSHRRRRRRRGTEDIEIEGSDDDEVETVTKVRAPRLPDSHTSNTVTGVRGSTRLEAKRARRRESRSMGRRRHIVTEAEFLARRESVDRQMLVRQKDDRIQIAVLEDGVLAEHFVSKTQQDSLIGNVYLGKVQNVLPSMEAAFVDIGRGRNAVLYAGEVNWDVSGLEGTPRKIENALKPGDSVLVQVTKDPIGQKGARLTSQVSLPGRFLVYVPGGSMTGISRKLPDTERARLKKILKDKLPDGAGVIVRTAAEGASEEELTHDINRLRAQWEEIQQQANSRKVLAPEMLYQEPDLMIKTVRDVFNEDFTAMQVQGADAWDSIEAYVTYVAPDLMGRLQKWEGEDDLFDHYRVNEQLSKALDRKVYLPSGGSLVIDRTEAMTVVDVNTGKFTGSGGNLEETVTKNNLEAAEEIVRQLRLRDIGGIIVIDFIDMVLESNRDLVLRRLIECLGRDRTKHQVAEVTSLGLVQMTRKRLGTGLLEVFSQQCESCGGRGLLVHDQPLSGRSGGASDFIHRQERTDRKRSRAAASRVDSVDAEKEEKKAERRSAMASIAAASQQPDEAEEQGRKKRKRRKRSRRTEGAEEQNTQNTQGTAPEAASEQAHEYVAQAEAKIAKIDDDSHWSGEQGAFTAQDFADSYSPELDSRFTRSSARYEAIRAGEAKARASQKAGRIARTEGGGFRSKRVEGEQVQKTRDDVRVEDVHESPKKSRRSRRVASTDGAAAQGGQTAVSGVVGHAPAADAGAPRVSGVIRVGGSAEAQVPEAEPVKQASTAAAEPAAAPRKRRSRRAASSAGAQSKVVTVDAAESAHGSVVASASVADAKAPVESETPTLFGIGVSAADIKRAGKK